LFIFVGAPYVESLRRQRALNAALSCVTAAVVGVILNLSVWFALHTIFRRTETMSAGPLQLDVPVWASLEPGALLLGAAALTATLKFKIGMGWTLIGTAVVGAAYWLLRYGAG
jgi:chromate transporter